MTCENCDDPVDTADAGHDSLPSAGAKWRNRIVGHGLEDPESLLANPLNWRIHPKGQQDALSGAIADIGFIRSVTVNQRTGFVVDGHLRVILALRAGERAIPVEYVDLSEREEAEALATLDPISQMAVADSEKVGELVTAFATQDAALTRLLEGMQTGAQIASFVPNIDPQTGREIVDEAAVEYSKEMLENKFADASKAAAALMIEIVCPHCCQHYWISKNEVLNIE